MLDYHDYTHARVGRRSRRQRLKDKRRARSARVVNNYTTHRKIKFYLLLVNKKTLFKKLQTLD